MTNKKNPDKKNRKTSENMNVTKNGQDKNNFPCAYQIHMTQLDMRQEENR
jgi:hypothetical protein